MECSEVVERVAVTSDDALVRRMRELEGRRREVEAETAVVLAELDRRKSYRADGHATMWGLLRCSVGWSDRECRERMRLAHLVDAFPDAGETLYDAQASVANLSEIARAHANPRCGDQIGSAIGNLLNEACRAEYDDLRTKVRTWERTADMDGAHRDLEANHANRNAHVVVWDGVGHAAAQWGEIDGFANREIFDQFVQAEWEFDWAVTLERYGDDASKLLMPRTDAQRRADAMTKIFERAASAPPGSRAPEPVVNVHVDHHTYTDILTEAALLPERAVDPFEARDVLPTERRCETASGDPVDPYSVLQHLIEGYVRFVILDDEGVPIRWGRRRRFFTGPVREAVLAMTTRCTHPGCRRPARRSEVDHATDWSKGGVTNPSNGGPRCRKHNLIKNHGFTVWRDPRGRWHTYRPDGSEIC
jgi:hypothetical protein